MSWIAAATPTGDPLIDWLTQAGAIGALSFIVVGFIRGWIVSGSSHKRVIAEKERALDLVYQQAEISQRALEAAERKRDERVP
jgi:hypothetical protein